MPQPPPKDLRILPAPAVLDLCMSSPRRWRDQSSALIEAPTSVSETCGTSFKRLTNS